MALSQVVNKNPSTSKAMDNPSCQNGTVSGTPKGMRDIITIGEKKGMMLDQVASGLIGSLMELIMMMMAMMMVVAVLITSCHVSTLPNSGALGTQMSTNRTQNTKNPARLATCDDHVARRRSNQTCRHPE